MSEASAIQQAIEAKDLSKLRSLLEAAPGLVRAAEQHGGTPLHLAVEAGEATLVEAVLAFKAEIDAKDEKGWTPLHWAAAGGRAGMARLLLAHGADATATGARGETPEQLALQGLDLCAKSTLMAMVKDSYTEVLAVLRAPNQSVAESPGTDVGGVPAGLQESGAGAPDPRFPGLDDADPLKRAECAIRLGKEKNQDAADRLIAKLQSEGDLFVQAAFSQALRRIGDERALPVLRKTLRGLRDDALSQLVLMAWSTSITQENVLPEFFSDLDEDADHLYSLEQRALRADAGLAGQFVKAMASAKRREYVLRSVLVAVAQLGERIDVADIIPFLTWTWEEHAVLESHEAAADALTILMDRLPADESLNDELRQWETDVRRSKEHAAGQGWNVAECTNRTLDAIRRKRRAIRKQAKAQARARAAQEPSKRRWWEFWR
jgi:hypothetical protein